MGLRLAPSALAIAYCFAALSASLNLMAGARAQPTSPADDAQAPQPLEQPADTQDPGPERGPVALHWVRLPDTERCIAGDALARMVESKLRRSVFPATRDATILIEGHVRKTEVGYAAELHMRDRAGKALGSRELSSQDETCTELSDTLAVVLAVMIDPDAANRPAPPAPPPAELPKPAAEREGEDNDRVLAFGRAVLALTQHPLLGFGAAYERALGAAGGLRIEVATFADNGTPISEIGAERAEARVRVTYAGAAYCPLWLEFTRTRLIGCAGLELGGVRGHQSSFPVPRPDQRGIWASGSASLRLTIQIAGPLEAHVAAGLVGAFGHRFVVELADERRERILPRHDSQLGALLDLGLGARF